MSDVELSLECLRATVNVMRYDHCRRASEVVRRVVLQGFTREQAMAAIKRIAQQQETNHD